MKKADADRRKLGRPLSFEPAAVLHKAMLAFWRDGYESTSIADLTAAMGVTAPSLYAVFGNKKQLFLVALRLYAGDPAVLERWMNAAPSAYEAVAEMLRQVAVLYTGETTPPGCLLANAAASTSADSVEVRQAVAGHRRAVRDIVVRRVEADIRCGLLTSDTSACALGDFAVAVAQGMAMMARDGAGRPALLAIGDAAMRAWPATSSAKATM